MCVIIHGIPVLADSTLSREEISKLVYDFKQAWTWEGRLLGRIELIRTGQLVSACAYDKPSIKLVPIKQ